VPFAIIWFGVEPSAAVFIIAIGVFWIVFFATQGAVRGVDRDLIEVAQAFGFRSSIGRLVKILIPASTPGIPRRCSHRVRAGLDGGGGGGDLWRARRRASA
jgi:NitT/TauT family transport system permease protein